jgi:4-nitrophenol 2-monooxygenase / 4-nitrocatechol 4-monooxygenase, reductase component
MAGSLDTSDRSEGSEGSETLTGDRYREVIGHFASGVTVITTAVGEERFGTTANAVSSLSVEPPMLLVCLNRDSTTGQAIDRSGWFVVNILTEAQEALAGHFATKDPNKFDTVRMHPGGEERVLLHGCLAHIECHVDERVTSATHVIYLGLVEAATASEGKPLAYYRGRFGRLQIEGAESR